MNEITCGLCMDLIPLVKDGIASEDSRKAVEAHIQTCDACRNLFNGEIPPAVNTKKVFLKFKRQAQLFSAMLMMFGIFFGLSLTAKDGQFYNSLIMPFIGVFGYVLFRWKALYTVPVLLLATHGLTNLLGLMRGTEHLDLYSLLMWTIVYSIFAVIGIVIAYLLHYAFRKEK